MRNEERTCLYFARREYLYKYYLDCPFGIFKHCPVDQARGKDKTRLNELFIMLDTETSKSQPDEQYPDGRYFINDNYIVAWSCSINIYGMDIMTIWGDSPDQILPFLEEMHNCLKGNKTIIYLHHLAYDWQFLRKWCYEAWGDPVAQLNTKPHYPVNIDFANGITLRDSLILAQRSIERWAKDLNAPNGKAVGAWDYDRIRHQREPMTDDELKYIECDVLAGVECLAILRKTLGVTYNNMPYTQTGIVRSAARESGKPFSAHKKARDYYYKGFEVYHKLVDIYHGGYTHANRHISGWTIEESIECRDFLRAIRFVCSRNQCRQNASGK